MKYIHYFLEPLQMFILTSIGLFLSYRPSGEEDDFVADEGVLAAGRVPNSRPASRPVLAIKPGCLAKMYGYAKACGDMEVTWFAAVEEERGPGASRLVISEVPGIPYQIVSASHVTVDPDDLSDYLLEYARQGGRKKLACWGHSHGAHQVFHSSIDLESIKEFLQVAPWMVSLVINRQFGSIDASLFVKIPVLNEIKRVDNLVVELWLDPAEEQAVAQEVQQKVRMAGGGTAAGVYTAQDVHGKTAAEVNEEIDAYYQGNGYARGYHA